MVGALTLGINSGAYVAEIIRGGLMSVDPGQIEAGRSLGPGLRATPCVCIVIPQAFKNILPALGNEFIMLLKDTSLITAIGGKEMVYAAQAIYGQNLRAYVPPHRHRRASICCWSWYSAGCKAYWKGGCVKVIDVKHLSKSFGDHLVLEDISEHIYPGEKSGHHRPLRLRQVHLPALPEPAGSSPPPAPSPLTAMVITDPKANIDVHPPEDGHGVPALQPLPQHDHPARTSPSPPCEPG